MVRGAGVILWKIKFPLVELSSFILELFLYSSPVAYWAPTSLGSSSFSITSFPFSYCPWGSQGENTEVFCVPFSKETHFVRTLDHNLSVLRGPT